MLEVCYLLFIGIVFTIAVYCILGLSWILVFFLCFFFFIYIFHLFLSFSFSLSFFLPLFLVLFSLNTLLFFFYLIYFLLWYQFDYLGIFSITISILCWLNIKSFLPAVVIATNIGGAFVDKVNGVGIDTGVRNAVHYVAFGADSKKNYYRYVSIVLVIFNPRSKDKENFI